MNIAALEEHWRQLQRWAWRHLNFPHPGGRADHGVPTKPIAALTTPSELAVVQAQTRTLSELRQDEMNAQRDTLRAARTAWEEHSTIRVTPAIDASEQGPVFKTPARRVPQD